jgi:hypothetical protein
MGDSRIKDVSSLLSSFFDEDKRRRGGRYADFFGAWRQIAGERLAAHSRVQDIENGILIIEAEHPGWIQLLQFRQAEMLETACRRFPELGLRGISFRLANDAASKRSGACGTQDEDSATETRPGPFGPGSRAPRNGPEESLPAEDVVRREAILEDISDPSLRALLGELKKTVEGQS